MAGPVDGKGKGGDALAFGLVEGLLGVVDGVLLLGAIAAVAMVLRPAVAEEEEDAHLRVRLAELVHGVANGGAHPRRPNGRDLVDALLRC